MIADIVPVLAAVTSLPAEQVDVEFSEALTGAVEENGGRLDSRCFVQAVAAFRAAHPFGLQELQSAQVARREIDARVAGAS